MNIIKINKAILWLSGYLTDYPLELHTRSKTKQTKPYSTHQPDEEKEDLEAPAKRGDTGDVTVAHGGHGHHQEVNTVPVREILAVLEVGRVSGVLQLGTDEGRDERNS